MSDPADEARDVEERSDNYDENGNEASWKCVWPEYCGYPYCGCNPEIPAVVMNIRNCTIWAKERRAGQYGAVHAGDCDE